jgi:hypothetical protein
MNRKARIAALEQVTVQTVRGAYIWQQPGQTREQALAAAGLPADAPNHTFQWRELQ